MKNYLLFELPMTIQKNKGFKRIYLAFMNSVKGFQWLVKNEAAFQQELILIVLLSIVSGFLNVSLLIHLLLIVSLLFVLLVEVPVFVCLFNCFDYIYCSVLSDFSAFRPLSLAPH